MVWFIKLFENTSKNDLKRFTRGIPMIPQTLFEIFGIEVTVLTKIENMK